MHQFYQVMNNSEVVHHTTPKVPISNLVQISWHILSIRKWLVSSVSMCVRYWCRYVERLLTENTIKTCVHKLMPHIWAHILQWRHMTNGGLNHRQCNCFDNSLPSYQQAKYQNSKFLPLYDGNPPVTSGFPRKGPVMQKVFPCHNVTTIALRIHQGYRK